MIARFRGADGWHSLEIRRHPRARRAKLRIDPHARRPILTLPPRASLKRAGLWIESQRGWIEAKLADLPPARPLLPGTAFPYRGGELRVRHEVTATRRPERCHDNLVVGGPAEAVPGRVLAWLRDSARTILAAETEALALRQSLPVPRVSVGDARTRWGSCSARGSIRYSWRLVMAPPRVLSATVTHEVAHLVHMNHGPDFHALVAAWFGADPSPERAWLRQYGPGLYQVGVIQPVG